MRLRKKIIRGILFVDSSLETSYLVSSLCQLEANSRQEIFTVLARPIVLLSLKSR
ncbi:MAG: hypothetical protein WCG27_13265 [Pseudomonadota bacterium]